MAGWIAVLVLFPKSAWTQEALIRQRDVLASVPKAMPSDLMGPVAALGARMRIAGKEESVFEGQFVDATGRKKALRVVHQISGVVRIESPVDKTSLSFDGDVTQGIRDRDGESLVDTFVLDSPEGMIYAIRNGASMQLLGRGFVSDSKRSDPQVPRYDIYEVTSPDRTNKTSGFRRRLYYFDSQTGLLASTRYTDRDGAAVETRFSGWGQVDGSMYPSRIERYENGHLSFSFVAGTVTARSRQDSANSK
jgi:hypothetical protein